MNCSRKLVVVHEHKGIALCRVPPGCIVGPEPKDGLELTVKFCTEHYKEVQDQQSQIERNMEVEHEETERKGHD